MWYGATVLRDVETADDAILKSPFSKNQVFSHAPRNALNGLAIVISFLVPWSVFCITSALFAFNWHWTHPICCYFMAALVFALGVATPGALACSHWMKKRKGDPGYYPAWYTVLAVACLVAFVAGTVVGGMTYSNFLQPYYNLEHMAVYKHVEPYRFTGEELMDAGRIEFANTTKLFLGRSMGFKNTDIYCVAPIVTATNSAWKDWYSQKGKSYDFWAVGKNCCSGNQADFHCPGFGDPSASGGLRLMSSTDRAFYRLAVQQAEATYKITASHPLFFQWVHNADEEMRSFQSDGISSYLMGMLFYFVFQLFVTIVVTLLFSKLVHT